jgi:hypothetical protein
MEPSLISHDYGPGTTAPTIVLVERWLDEAKKRLGQ